jgi:hypothetical protein
MSEPETLAARKGDWRKRVIAQRRPRQPSQPPPGRFGGAFGLAELSRSTSKSNKKGLGLHCFFGQFGEGNLD